LFIGINIFNEDVDPETPPIEIPNVEILVKDSIFRDSIYIVKDSIIERIVYVEKNYEETVNNILSNSDSANIQFFTDYIERYNNK
jgi:hypothetical protein